MCDCDICKRSGIFKKHLENVSDEESKEWFQGMFECLMETEEDLYFHKLVSKNLRTLYPKIYKETFTAESLSRFNADYPEKQL